MKQYMPEPNNEQEKPKSIFDGLAEKLRQMETAKKAGNGSENSASKPVKTPSLDLFDIADRNIKRKTAIIEVQKDPAAPACLKPAPKISDCYWNEPFDIYGRILRKEGAGFGSENIIAYFIKLDSIQPSLENLAARAEEIKQIIQEGGEEVIEHNYASKAISEIEKIFELKKLSEKREAFLHYTGICYLGLWMARHSNSLQSEKEFPEKEKENRQCVHSMYSLLLDMAKYSFVKHNRDPAKPKDKDSTKEEDLESKDTAKKEYLEAMCSENGAVFNVFHQTIMELAGLFAKQFSEMSPENISFYHNMLHSNSMKNLLVSLGSSDLTTLLWQIEAFSEF
jgi:hypothetical protein